MGTKASASERGTVRFKMSRFYRAAAARKSWKINVHIPPAGKCSSGDATSR
jgi:hypothetical protein